MNRKANTDTNQLLQAAFEEVARPQEKAAPQMPDVPSQTLAGLDASRRPTASTVCEACPHSVWFTSPKELRCYCRVMYLVTWSSKEPLQITACDGPFLE